MRAATKLVLLGIGTLATILLAGLPGLGQGVLEPSGELSDAECYGHHKQEGFRSFDLYPVLVQTVPKGQDFAFQMTIRNPWLHEVRDLYGYVDVSNAPGIALEGGKDPVEEPMTGQTIDAGPQSVQQYTTRTYDIMVEENATEVYVRVMGSRGTQVPLPTLRDKAADYDLTLTSPDGATVVLTGPDPSPLDESMAASTGPFTYDEEIRVNQRNLTAGGTGAWQLTVAYRGFDSTGNFDLFTGVYYNVTGILLMPGPAVLQPNEKYDFTFNLKVKDVEGLQSMRYGGLGLAYHEHTDRNIGDEGNYDKWSTMQFETGATLTLQSGGPQVAVGPGADTLGPVFRRWGQVLGFAGAFLIIPSLVFGGTFGKASVVSMNKWFGGPRRRVLFHNSMSFWLLAIAVLHTFLFLYEAFWNWSHGLVWGGLALACMIGLGVTGATQRAFVARWGFNRWRFVHFAMGILVAVFVIVHILADGSHLAPIRTAWFGGSGTDAGGINL